MRLYNCFQIIFVFLKTEENMIINLIKIYTYKNSQIYNKSTLSSYL